MPDFPRKTTPTFRGKIAVTPGPRIIYEQQPVLRPPLEIVTIAGKVFEIYDRSNARMHVVAAAQRHVGLSAAAEYTTDVAFYLIGKEDPNIQNHSVEQGYPTGLEEVLNKAMDTIRKLQ